MKKTILSITILLFLTGCDLQDSSDANEYDDYSDNTNNTSTVIKVSIGGDIMGAYVVDVNDKVATYIGGKSYEFKGHIRYPIMAYGGYVDVDNDGQIGPNDITNNIPLRANLNNNITLLTTYMAGEPNTDNSDPRTYYKTETDLKNLTGLTNTEDLYKLPEENIEVSAFNRAIFKIAQNNLSTIGTELNLIVDDDFKADYNIIKADYINQQSSKTNNQINKDNFLNMFISNELQIPGTYLFYPKTNVDLTKKDFIDQPDFWVKGQLSNGYSFDQITVNDSVFTSIPLYLEAYGRLQVQVDVLTAAITKYGYQELKDAKNYNLSALVKVQNILDRYNVFTEKYASFNFTYPSLSNNYNDVDLKTWYDNNINSLNNNNARDFSIDVTRYEWEKSMPFFKMMLLRYLPDMQYGFRDIYIDLRNSRDKLENLADRL